MAGPPEQLRGFRTALASRYRVDRELGRGGMATVYLAHDLKHERQVAVKVLKPELAAAVGPDRFLREIRVTARLNHPHILPLLDSGEADGILYYVMPYVEGESLRHRLTRERELPIAEALHIAREVADALAHAHDLGIIHRDIKPENILLSGGHALVTDFGIARAKGAVDGDTLTLAGQSLGTPAYMSPEQAMAGRELDGRTDQYSLGAVLYEMLTGEPPFTGKTSHAIIARLITDQPTSLRTFRDAVPESLERTVLRALAKAAADRFETVREFARQLERVARDVALPEQPVAAARPRAVGIARWSAYAAGAALVAGAVLVVAVIRNPRAPPRTPAFRQLTFVGNVSQAALSPDGKLVAYVASPRLGPFVNQRERILVKQVPGDAAHTVADSLSGICGLRFTPAGDRLTFSTNGGPGLGAGAYSISWLGGSPTPIVQGPVPCDPVLSPDGSRAVWLWYDDAGEVVMIREIPVGSGQRDTVMLGGGRKGFGDASWSRSGHWIVAMTDTGLASPVLETISPDDGSMNTIVTGDPFPRSPRWSADDAAIYYAAGSPDAANLMKLRIDGRTGRAVGQPQLLLAGVPLYSFDISADGDVLAMTRAIEHGRISVGSIPTEPGGAPVTLQQVSEGNVSDGSPAISPDGHTVAFTRGEVTDNEIFVRASGGGPAERITSIKGRLTDLQWSPDGQQLAFVWDSAETQWLGVVSVSSRRWRRLYQGNLGPAGPVSRLSWASTGIAFVSFTSDTSVVLSLLDPETSRVYPIPMPAGHECPGLPLTSPEGSSVLSDGWCPSTNRRDRVILSLPHGERLSSLEYKGYPAGWATNGRVYHHRTVNDNTEIWSVPIEGGSATLHARLETRCFRVTVSRDGRTFACAEYYTESDVWLVEGFDRAVLQ